MAWLHRFIGGFRALFQKTRMEQELDAELREFLEATVDRKMLTGMSREAAVRAARLEIGSVEAVKDRVRDVGWESTLESFWQDVRYALRSFIRNPGFTAVAVITLALGIGATTAIFSLVDGLLLRSLPYPEPNRLVWLWGQVRGGPQRASVNPLEYLDYREQNRIFAHLAAAANFAQTTTLTGRGEPESLRLSEVSGNYFAALGVRPLLGRHLLVEDEQAGRSDVAVLSHGLWRRRFGADPAIAGSAITLDGRSVRVVGVMPADFRPPRSADLWTPMPFYRVAGNRRAHFMRPIGRLEQGVTLGQAQAEMDVIARRLEQQYPESSAGWSVRLVPLDDPLRPGGLRRPLWVLFGAVGFLLLMACANIAGLLLARASSRTQEVAVRSALGAGRRRIVRQLLTESLVLALFGSALGVMLGYGALNGWLALTADNLPAWSQVAIDERVLAFALLLTMVTALLFGLVPAFEATRPNPVETLKAGVWSAGGVRPRRIRSLLVVAQVATAVLLLVGAGLFMRSLISLQNVHPGFTASEVLTLQVDLPSARYRQSHQIVSFYEELQQRLAAIPGVTAVGMTAQLPLSGQMNDVPFAIEGRSGSFGDRITVDHRFVNHDYLRAMSIPLFRGRSFSAEDARRSAPVALISQRMAERFFTGENPIGQRLRIENTAFEIVGVVGDIRHRSLATDAYATMYVPSLVSPNTNLVIRTAGSPAEFAPAVQSAVRAIDKDLALSAIRPLERVLDASVAEPRLNTALLNVFAALALVLALTGIYGLVSYTVSERTRDIGIRMALGATRADIEKLVLGVGARLAVAGVGLGLMAAIGLSRAITGMLFGVSPTDPTTYMAITTLLAGTVIVACWLPARRASNIDPIAATRCN